MPQPQNILIDFPQIILNDGAKSSKEKNLTRARIVKSVSKGMLKVTPPPSPPADKDCNWDKSSFFSFMVQRNQ